MKLLRSAVVAVAIVVALAGAGAGAVPGAESTSEPVYEPDGPQGTLYRLYRAHLLREPDRDGYDYWWAHVHDGLSLTAVSDHFAASAEFTSRYGQLTDGEFVTLVYRNVLEREPDPDGHAHWLDQLARMGMTRGTMVMRFAESAEFRHRTEQGLPPGHRPCPDGGIADPDSWTWSPRVAVWAGVDHRSGRSCGPVEAHVVRIAPGAIVHFDALVSNGAVGQGKQTTSAMCAARRAAACVNANFPICFACVSPFGAVVRDGRLLVSPAASQVQVWTGADGRFRTDDWTVTATLQPVNTAAPPLTVDAVNAAPGPDRLVLLDSAWGTTTGASEESFEVAFEGIEPLRTGGVRHRIRMGTVVPGGDASIPDDGFVLTGHGRGAAALRAFVESHAGSHLDLSVDSPLVREGVSGDPLLLLDGVPQPLDQDDTKVSRRHPRTVIGWDDVGTRWLVVVDGRQNRSVGVTLAEATDLLALLGATTAVNLDGGGSSTVVTWCGPPVGWCIRNHPSDGAERPVATALAVVPADGR